MAGILKALGVESDPTPTPKEAEAPPEALLFDPRERDLELAAADAEKRKASPQERVRLWLELAELHRTLAAEGAQKRARLKQAEMVVRHAVEIAAQAKDSPGYLSCLDLLASIFDLQKNYSGSEKIRQEGIRLESSLPQPNPLRMARRVHLLGLSQHRAGKSDDAVPVLERAVKLHEDTLGVENDETVRVLAELGYVHRARGRHDLAQRCIQYALRHFQNTKGAGSPEAMETLSQLVGCLEEAGNRDRAAEEYERMLLLLEREVGRNQEDIGEMQFSVASIYIGWGNYTRARELLNECLGTFRRGGGPRLAVAHETLAHVEEHSGHFSDAVRELASAGKVWAKCKNRTTELVANLNYRADLLDQLKRKKEAAWIREQVAQVQSNGTSSEPLFSERAATLRPSSA
jgi:tetratricopeptide (TPR) repeat protein